MTGRVPPVGIVGPWHPFDAVDRALLEVVDDRIRRHLRCDSVLVLGQGRQRFAWQRPTVDADRLLALDLAGIVLVGDLPAPGVNAGALPYDVWEAVILLARARGWPVVAWGVRLLGDAGRLDPLVGRLIASCWTVDASSALALGDDARVCPHPVQSVPGPSVGDRSGVLVHATPSALAARRAGWNPGRVRWIAPRPSRGDRLVAIPATERLPHRTVEELDGILSRSRAVITDDPGMGALARRRGATWDRPVWYQGGDAEPEPTVDHASVWQAISEAVIEGVREDASPLRDALARVNPEPRLVQTTVIRENRPKPVEMVEADDQPPGGGPRQDEEAARWRTAYEHLRSRRSVRMVLGVIHLYERLRARLRRSLLAKRKEATGAVGAQEGETAPSPFTMLTLPNPRVDGSLVSVIVYAREGDPAPDDLLAALRQTRYREVQVILLEGRCGEQQVPSSEEGTAIGPASVVRVPEGESDHAAYRAAREVAEGAYLLLLDPVVSPIDVDWLGWMVDAAEREGVGAVGGRLVDISDPPPDATPGVSVDLVTLHQRGIDFEPDGQGFLLPARRGAGEQAGPPVAPHVESVPAASAACLLLPTAMYDEVGGWPVGCSRPLADIELCLSLRDAGHDVVVDDRATFLVGARSTPLQPRPVDVEALPEPDLVLLADRWGPRLHRQVLLDRVKNEGVWSSEPLRTAICGDAPTARSDASVAAGERLGWTVTRPEPGSVTHEGRGTAPDVIVLFEPPAAVEATTNPCVTVAWVSQEVEDWLGLPWFEDIDLVVTEDEQARTAVRARSSHEPRRASPPREEGRSSEEVLQVLQDLLIEHLEAPRLDVYIGVSNRQMEHRWGDTHFARDVQRQLRRHGVTSRLVRAAEGERSWHATSDAVLVLLGRLLPRPRSGQRSVLWSISHPELLTSEVCERYDLVLVASSRFAIELDAQMSVPVVVFHQATEPDRFVPIPAGPAHDLLFVGNSRNVRRHILDEVLPTPYDLAVYGYGWTDDLVDTRHVKGDYVPNEELAQYYSAASIVLNDHWPEMRERGYVSNRIFDALAAGALVISDRIEGLDELLNHGVVTYRDRADLQDLIDRYLESPSLGTDIAERGRAAVLRAHTFAHRVEQLLTLLGDDQRATIGDARLAWRPITQPQPSREEVD